MCLTLQQTTFWSHSLEAMPGLGATKMRIKQTSSSGLMGQPSHLRAGWAVSLTVRTRTAFTWILQEIGLMGEARMQRNSSANIKVSQKFMVFILCFCVSQFNHSSENPRVCPTCVECPDCPVCPDRPDCPADSEPWTEIILSISISLGLAVALLIMVIIMIWAKNAMAREIIIDDKKYQIYR